MESGIRKYGPGKFQNYIDQYVYALSCEGFVDEEVGSIQENGEWYGMIRGSIREDVIKRALKDHTPHDLTKEELDLIDTVGIIVSEDSDGFFWVTYYDDSKVMEHNWESIKGAIEDFYVDEEEEE